MIHAIDACHSMFNISLEPLIKWHISATCQGVEMKTILLRDCCMVSTFDHIACTGIATPGIWNRLNQRLNLTPGRNYMH